MTTSSALWAIPLVSLISGASSPSIVNETYNQPSSYNSLLTHQDKPFVIHSNLLESIQPKYVIEFRSKPTNEWMIMVNNQPTFLVKDLPNAVIAAAHLTMMMNAPDFDPYYLEPLALDGEYIGKYKNSILFKIPKSEVVNPSLKLTQWINNLRVSAGAEPLTLVEAQKQMHQLAATGEQIDGLASWYGPYFQGRQTASGEQFEQRDFTAAHPSLPFDTYLKVTNQQNGKSVVVRINDRGPYFGDRNLDLSHAAAIALNSDEAGVVPIVATILVSNN
ncbi:septal ring lytic transglycosylase RlpA family protein [Pseudanabaena galeata UHCC 0370]|jgi:rare lipoprotein A|uniref:Probable endolytic peptidoglycan transglycosylase RlpA n=1 Tax=Pseudanabaena galeata UHCC 0370 TaxID=3110310 RepID=A0ABU5TNH8_9CYAN|nr:MULTISPECIES: septal ring lytic transglycosylase RlpA family protein [Pseudanabaena]MEA5479819.1 septal ring lytic transglycosylase RlpA family protein [Pseudanabaena galeata UHCC 0370]MEA5487346.1 septal ring lytic transglycosylase RlpA family protein [Pseudanabaena sp. CCNP1317]WGS73218.1 septal ring lytic transglycosylase RlpA family protein [Pseudanabaena galeata CCNP1313]